jgi:hypothetical protein
MKNIFECSLSTRITDSRVMNEAKVRASCLDIEQTPPRRFTSKHNSFNVLCPIVLQFFNG